MISDTEAGRGVRQGGVEEMDVEGGHGALPAPEPLRPGGRAGQGRPHRPEGHGVGQGGSGGPGRDDGGMLQCAGIR